MSLAMSSLLSHSVHPSSKLSVEEDNLVRKLLLSHDPDGRHLDSEQLLRAMENILRQASTPELVSGIYKVALPVDIESKIEVVESEEPLGLIISKLSGQIRCKYSGEGDLHKRTMTIFDLLEKYRWDAKVVLVLAAYATSYGEFWLILQLYPQNPLAVLVAMLKQFPKDINALKPRFKALSLVVKTMIAMTKFIITFEGLPIRYLQLNDDQTISTTKSIVFLAAYWITRTALICSSHIRNLIALKPENSNAMMSATWELSSLVYRLSSMCSRLKHHVDASCRLTEIKMHEKLLVVLQESQEDNQELLKLLFALKDDLPLKNCITQAKLGISELKDKVVILLISKAEICAIEKLFLLIHQTYDHPEKKKIEGNYEIVWMPISSSETWTDDDEITFDLFSSSLPWYSIRHPNLLDSAVMKFIKEDLGFNDKPMMVVLNPQGMITNLNALDMLLIWGPGGYPFSIEKEADLWLEEKWTLKLLFDEIDPLISTSVKEGRTICFYGSSNLDWIKEFNDKMQTIISEGLQIELVYVGKKNPDERVRNILATVHEKMHKRSLSFTEIQFFWFRLESMRESILRVGQEYDNDHILEQASTLLDDEDNKSGWAALGKVSLPFILKLHGRKLMEYLNRFPEWERYLSKLGFVGALRYAIEPPVPTEPCDHSPVISYEEGSGEEIVVCAKCMRPMKKFVAYK